jgi:muramoyltetrapeptide carboxypeptidase
MSAAFTDLPQECVEVEQRMLRGEIPSYTCEGSDYDKQGQAEGILIGGNLSTFTSVLGTVYDCTKTDQPYILFFEDESEDLQHVHRYLAVLKHLGVLDRASGIVVGEWVDVPTDMDDYDGSSRGGAFKSMSDMISRQYLSDLDIPVAFDFPAGHGETNYPLLMGAKARLDVSAGSFTLSWV